MPCMTPKEYYRGMPKVLRGAIIFTSGLLVMAYALVIMAAISALLIRNPITEWGGAIAIGVVILSMVHDRRKWAESEERMRDIWTDSSPKPT